MLQCGMFLIDHARNYPHRAAVITNRRTLTYDELNRESNCLANALRRRGVCKGDRISLLMKNSAEWVVIWYACQKLGAVFVPLHSRLTQSELIRAVRLANSVILIYGAEFGELAVSIRSACSSLHTLICADEQGAEGNISWAQLLADRTDEREVQVPLTNDDPALILFTSGTTAASKGIIRTQEMVALHGITLALGSERKRRSEVMLTTAPLYHTGGLLCLFKMAVLGGTLVLPDRFDPAEVPKLIERHRVTQLILSSRRRNYHGSFIEASFS